MKKIKEFMNNTDEHFYDCMVNYNDILNSFEFEILLKIDDASGYSGDTRVLLKDNNNIGYLLFGWGSCSVCDALQGCNSWENLEDLQKELYNAIKWLSPKEMLDFMKNHDWEGDFSWNCEEQKQFVEQAIIILINEF